MATTKPTKEKKRKALGLTRDDVPECMHTALRKCCDSTPTSLLWNLIYVMDEGMLHKYWDAVFLALKIAEGTDIPQWYGIHDYMTVYSRIVL